MSVSTVDESVDLKISASACEGDRWRVYAQKSMVARKAWLSAKEEIHGTTMGPEPGSTHNQRMEPHQKLLPVPVARRPLQCEKSVVVRYEYLNSESIFRVNSGRLGQVLKASPPCLPPRSDNAWDLCDTQSISESEELTLATAAAAVEVKKNGPIYRLFNSLVHPKQEDSSNTRAPSIPAQSSSLRNQSGQASWLPNPSDNVVADPDAASDVAYGKGSFQRSKHMDVLLPHLELDFPAGNSVGFSGIQLQKPQPTMSIILSPNSSTSETKRKPVSRLSKKRPQVPNSCSTSQFSQTITQELPPNTGISNVKQKSTRGGARLTRTDSRRRERQDSAAPEESKTSSRVSASPYTLALSTFISDSDEEFYILPRSLSDESIQLDAFLADLPALEAERPRFEEIPRPTCVPKNRDSMGVVAVAMRDS